MEQLIKIIILRLCPAAGPENKIINKNTQKQVNNISLQSIVGKGYAEYWHCKCRYRVCKGSRASKKSKTTALWIISNMMKYKEANTLVIRKTFRTLNCLLHGHRN